MIVTGQWVPRRWWPVRLGVSLAALGGIVYGINAHTPGFGLHGQALALLICVVVACLGWLVRTVTVYLDNQHRTLTATAAGGALVTAGGLLMSIAPVPAALALAGVGAFTAAVELTPALATTLTAAGVLVAAVGTATINHQWVAFAGYSAGLVALTLAGFNRRQYKQRLVQAEQLLTQTRIAAAADTRAAALDERTRIARDIHDVLAHSLGAVAVQLDAADALLEAGTGTPRARHHVQRARHLTVDGLTEARRAVGALRNDAPPLGDQLSALVADHHNDAATLTIFGEPRPLPANAALTIYRTAQEGLSNARKHAPGQPVTLHVHYHHDNVAVTITNPTGTTADGSALGATGGSYGLPGLAERATLLGGTLTAGQDATNWSLQLWLPT
ncbi:sensor histidine kinase [Amycolatopsis mediterranei]|uniref:sensor histidine kinase n=1 Tax=Amycolatopsis mediterranei TaxID=33910 RepID=UPI000A8A4DC6|nr:histidine kinase [Amycolatopsis mediterranei]